MDAVSLANGFLCIGCGALSEQYLRLCPRCFTACSFIKRVSSPFESEASLLPDESLKTAAELAASVSKWLPSSNETVSKVIGKLPCGPACIVCYGHPGSGKSTFSLLFADDFAANVGSVVVSSIEEGFSTSYSEKLRRLEIRSRDIHVCLAMTPAMIASAVRKVNAKLVVIDSITQALFAAEDIHRMMRELDVTIFGLLHINKAGAPRGSMGIVHTADVVLRLDKPTWYREKTRFDSCDSGPITWLDC